MKPITNELRKQKIRTFIASVAMLGFFGTLALLLFKDIPQRNEAAIQILLGAMGGYVAAVISFYFGDSDGAEHNK